MTIDSATILTFASAVIVGGVVPLVTFFYLKRGQLRQLDTTADATQISSAATLIALLQDQIKALTLKVEKAESQQTTDRTNLTEQLTRAHEENSRMAAIIAVQQTDLDIARRQITELRAANRMQMATEDTVSARDAMRSGVEEIDRGADDPRRQ
jgi:gamma-glutamylcysteine synthetase